MMLAQRSIHNPILKETPTDVKQPIDFLQAFIPKLINIGFIVAVIIFVFVILLGGISWMSAGGDKQKVEDARGKITNGIIGLFVVFFVFVIISVVEILFGVKIMQLDLGILKIK